MRASAAFAAMHGIDWKDSIEAAELLARLSLCASLPPPDTPPPAKRSTKSALEGAWEHRLQECALTTHQVQALALKDCHARFAGHVGTALVVALMAISMSLAAYSSASTFASATRTASTSASADALLHYGHASIASTRILDGCTQATCVAPRILCNADTRCSTSLEASPVPLPFLPASQHVLLSCIEAMKRQDARGRPLKDADTRPIRERPGLR